MWIILISLCFITELCHFFLSDFSSYEPSCEKMIWSSILAGLIHNMALLPHVQHSQLTGLKGPCGHVFCSVVIFLKIFLSDALKCKTEWEIKMDFKLSFFTTKNYSIFGMTTFASKIECLIPFLLMTAPSESTDV